MSCACSRPPCPRDACRIPLLPGHPCFTGDVWLTQAPLTAIDLAYAAPSPWSQPEAPCGEWSSAETAERRDGGRKRSQWCG